MPDNGGYANTPSNPAVLDEQVIKTGVANAAGMGSWMGPIGAIAGGVIGAGLNYYSAKQQMAFQERMANTQHQREVADLRAAGLNPILSATGGSGNAAPVGAMADMSAAGEGIASAGRMGAIELAQLKMQKDLNDANIDAIDANRAKTIADTKVVKSGIPYIDREKEAAITAAIAGRDLAKSSAAKIELEKGEASLGAAGRFSSPKVFLRWLFGDEATRTSGATTNGGASSAKDKRHGASGTW